MRLQSTKIVVIGHHWSLVNYRTGCNTFIEYLLSISFSGKKIHSVEQKEKNDQNKQKFSLFRWQLMYTCSGLVDTDIRNGLYYVSEIWRSCWELVISLTCFGQHFPFGQVKI
jgi:hypothetical protein